MLTAAITSTPTRRVGSFGLLIPSAARGGHRAPHRARTVPAAMIPGVVPLFLVLAGVVLLVAGALLMRGLGPRGRVGRILGAATMVPVARARELAEAGSPRYIGVAGRIDSEEDFEDERHRPLVLRRSRLETRAGRSWTAVEDHLQAVPFEIVDGLDRIAVDGDALDEGLVVITRESEGFASEIADRLPAQTPPTTPVRLRVEQVSSVEHAIVLGVPTMDAGRGPILRPGMRRPLILTTLEPAEAMRLLAVDRRTTTRAIAGLLIGGLAALGIGLTWWVIDAVA
jgi:hypothetical protein